MKTIGVLFDYNGVLVDDEAIHQMAFAATLRQYSIHLTDRLYARCCLGRTDVDGLRYLTREFQSELSDIPMNTLVAIKGSHYQRLVGTTDIFYPGATDTVRTLARYCRVAVVTSSSRKEVRVSVERASIAKLLDFIVAAEDVTRGKPDPEAYLVASRKLRLPTSHIVAVEDSPSGVEAAKSAGLRCIAVLHTTDAKQLAAADAIVDRVTDVQVTLIKSILKLTRP